MSARNGHAHGLGRAWRKLRGTPAAVTPEPPTDPELPPAAEDPMRDLYRHLDENDLPGEPAFDAEAGLRDLTERLRETPEPEPRERDVLDIIDEEVAQITPEHIEKRLQETLRRVGAAPTPAERCPRCTYPVGSIGCQNTHGGRG